MSLLCKSLWDSSLILFADRFSNRDPASDAASGITGLVCCGLFVGLPLLILAFNVAILFWVAKDAKSRGMDGAMWLFLIFFTGVIGLAIYLFSRPQGLLTQCHNCGNNRMEASIKCPHCGAGQDHQREMDEDEDEEDRPIAKQKSSSRRSVSRPGSVVTCPSCGVRLRLPKAPPGFGHKYTCPKCRSTVEYDPAT